MDVARCTLDNKVYNASDFSKLSDLNTKRKHLVCTECKLPAYFKKASKSGQAACFGARPHADGCRVASEESEKALGHLSADEKELINSGNEIKIDFTFESKLVTHTVEIEDEASRAPRSGSKHSDANGVGKAKSTRRLSSLLNMLILDSSFAGSKKKIDIGHNHPYNASTIFRSFENLTNNDKDQYKGVFGQIRDVVETKNGDIWINAGGDKDFGIVISKNIVDSFFERFHRYKDDTDELNGKYVLCFGFVNQSQNKKLFMRLDDVSKVAFK